MANGLLELPQDQFMGALDELGIVGAQRDDLIRQKRNQDSIFGGLFDYFAPQPGMERANILPMMRPEGMSGLEAITSGQAQLALPGMFTGALTGAAQAADAPRAAYAGQIPMQDMASEAANVAGALTLGGAGAAGRNLLDYDPTMVAMGVPGINRLDPNEWQTRIESSLPASWLDPKFDKPQWHGISNVSSDLPPQSMMPVLRSTGTLEPEAIRTIESLVGRTGIPALGDRSIAGNEVLGIGDIAYKNFIRSLGGADFMRERGTGIWANAGPQAQDLARTAEEVIRSGGDPALIFTAMGPQSADFSTMMADSVMNQYDPRRIDQALAARYDDAVRKAVPDFTSILNPNFLAGLTGTDRWNLWQLMDRAELSQGGFPNINLARRSITDPRLMDAVPFDAGLTFGRPTGGLLQIDSGVVPHPTYPAQLAGAYEGGLERSIPGAILWRDFFNRRRASGASPGGDQRSFLMNANKIKQDIDQQTVDEAGQFFERLRGLNDPSSPMRLWRGLLGD